MQQVLSYLNNKISAIAQLESLVTIFWNEFYSSNFSSDSEKELLRFLNFLIKSKNDCLISHSMITELWEINDD